MNRLALELTADANGLIKTLQQAQKSVNQFVQAAGGAGSAIGGPLNQSLSAFTNLAKGGGLAAGVLAGALVSVSSAGVAMALTAGKQAEQLDQLEQITGIGTDTLQQYDVMLNRAGLSGDDLIQVMKKMSTSLDQARQGTGSAADRFRQLGIDIRTVTSTDDLIKKISGSVGNMANGAEKAAIMSELMGKGWATFIKAFGGGTKAMDDAAAASERLGATLSGGQIAELAAMDDRVDDLTTAWTRFSQQLGSFVAPAVDFVARALSSVLAMASDALKSLNALGGVSAAADTRSKPPPMVDQSKVLERARANADAQVKIMDAQFKQEDQLAQARLQNFEAHLSARNGLDLAADVEMAQAREAAQTRMADFAQASIQTEIQNYQQYYAQKSVLFAKDEKGQADLAKFSIENAGKVAELMSKSVLAQINSDSAKVASARKTADLMKELALQPYQDAVVAAKTLDDAQRTLYASEAGMLGASDAARRVRMNLITEEAALTRATIDQTILDETRKAQAIQNLELETDTKRRQAIQQFPSFFESQMQAIVASNVFSMASMVSTWTSGIAQMVVHGGNLQAVWEQTQVAIVQASLNAGVQQLAQMAIAFAQQKAMVTAAEAAQIAGHTAMEVAKTAVSTAADAERTVASVAASKIMGAASVAAVTAGATAMLAVMDAVVIAIAGVFAAIGAGLAASIVGAAFAPAFEVAAGAVIVSGTVAMMLASATITAALAAATAASLAPGFSRGGIGDFGSGTPATLHGQEAIIPLNSRGASFMQDAFGSGGGGMQTIVIQMDGREMARRTLEYIPGIFYLKTGFA